MHTELYDVTIIGGGPAGLFSAFYSGLRGMKTKIIEFQPYLGGKVNVYPEKMIWDVGGLMPIPGAALIEQMVQQGVTFDPDVVLGEKVTSINKNDDGLFVIRTAMSQAHFSKTVILAIGGGIIKPIKLELEGAERFEVGNLHYVVKSLERFKERNVLISGGGNSAVDWANELEPIAKKVYLTYRKDMLKGHEADVARLFDSSVDCLLNTTIDKLIAGENHDSIEKVELVNNEDGTRIVLNVDDVIINHGYERDKELTSKNNLNIKMKDEYFIDGNPMSETSVPGLFAAGDILHHEGKLHLIAGAFQDAANAVNKAKQYIEPGAEETGRVSSHNEIFKERNQKLVKHLYEQRT
ncbi:NAD(P)/FAD-dependent oxidoreductase [Paenibacillus eucommiae]|uniref:Ferredoxin--NADP reductase n=1 Tax=Paenibacillus eucommiae TaxID=1355755 RepID=A0ABS4J2S4_9BACL|nr:NAD(P)/FAD-dependent oxidoreductase [Paenibacillus eucommiae]MBP1994133.1 thioredoxin reductase (NADPH) [Paenibacillus eucommiae]